MSDAFAASVVIALAAVIYFLPSFVAMGKKNNGGVIIINLFLGWTLVGWVVALAWAATLSRDGPTSETIGPSGETIPGVTPRPSETRPCPFCAEDIKVAAIVCKHCGRDLPRSDPEAVAASKQRADEVAPPPAAIP